MKKILFILLVLSFGMFSCYNKEINPNEVPADCIMLNVFNSPMTKTVDLNGEVYERQLNRLDCFFYVKGQTDQPCVFYKQITINENGFAEIPIYVDEATINDIFPRSNTLCDVFILANLPDGDYESGKSGTDIETLSSRILQFGNNYDAVDKPFIMVGSGEAIKGENNNASGTIQLNRIAAKITLTVNIPEKLLYENNENTKDDDVLFEPVFLDNNQNITLKTTFNNGANKTNISGTYLINNKNDLFSTSKTNKAGYIKPENNEIPATSTSPKKFQYTCEIPFYSYAREWDKGSDNVAYLTLEFPWKKTYKDDNGVLNSITGTYYYQILINGSDRCFEPNHWYDLNVNVGVIGSTVESEPKTIQDITYYVLDWTTEPDPKYSAGGDRYENVVIKDYTYLVVHNNRINMNNVLTGKVNIDASHPVKWELEWPEDIEIQASFDKLEQLYHKDDVAAYFINCSTNPASQRTLESYIDNNCFDYDQSNKSLIFTYPKTVIDNSNKVYSPVYVHLKVWLDINDDNKVTTNTDQTESTDVVDESNFVEYITFVYYPPLYIIPDPSTLRSIYVNGTQSHNNGQMDNVDLNGYKLGASTGVKNFNNENGHNNSEVNNSMYVINVSSLSEDDFFYSPSLHTNGYLDFTDGATNVSHKSYYIIGDPRQRFIDNSLNGTTNKLSWANAPALNGDSPRQMQYYYPTESYGESYRVIAPKFRIVSFNNASGKNCTPYSAAMRCASLQEDGFPAGRWRLPTVAEVQYVIKLQMLDVIEDIFLSTGSYYATASYANNNKSQLVTLRQNGNNIQWNKVGSGISVRCVYDEWYWGSERDALVNPSPTWKNEDVNGDTHVGDYYLFTWGDKLIW